MQNSIHLIYVCWFQISAIQTKVIKTELNFGERRLFKGLKNVDAKNPAQMGKIHYENI